jgi:hypothetical protein
MFGADMGAGMGRPQQSGISGSYEADCSPEESSKNADVHSRSSPEHIRTTPQNSLELAAAVFYFPLLRPRSRFY